MTPPDASARSDSFRPVLGATVLLVFALLAVAALKSNRDLQAARSREQVLQAKIAATRAESERLRARIDRLHHDPGMLERLAREDLGLVRPGDVIIELPEAGAAPPATPVPPAPAPPVMPRAVPAANPTPTAGSAGPPAPPAAPPSPSSGPPGRG